MAGMDLAQARVRFEHVATVRNIGSGQLRRTVRGWTTIMLSSVKYCGFRLTVHVQDEGHCTATVFGAIRESW
jgi:hypothetical protein